MDRNTDDAIETAERHAREAEERFVREPLDSPRLVPKARTVENRAADLHELAADAADEAADDAGEEPPPSD
jgi:hypothetical protein